MFQALAFAAVLLASDEPSEPEGADAGALSEDRSSTIIVSGFVRDVEGIPDVVVTLTSPSLQGEVVVVTDSHGIFVAQVSSPGTYTIRLEKETYRPYSRMLVELLPGDDVDLGEFVLLPEPTGDVTFYCGCCPPLVDVSESQARWTSLLASASVVPLSAPFESGGVSRSFDTRLRMFPGLSAGRNGTRNGMDPARELGARLDGTPVREPVTGLLAIPVGGGLVDESVAITEAPDATRGGSTSGWLEGTTFSGGNELHGRIFTTVTPSPLDTSATTLADVGAGVGGYLVKDRIWFAVGGQWPWAAPVSLDPGAQGMAKLTFLLSPDARVETRYFDAGARLLDHAVRSRLGAVTGNFSLNDKKLLFAVQAWWMGTSDRSPSTELDLSSQSFGGAGNATLLMTFWGHHVLKLGLEAGSSKAGDAWRGVLSPFLDESWTVADRITLLLGARMDVQRLGSGSGGVTVSGGLLPRLGAVFDPTYSGKAKIFGWWGRLEDEVPLALLHSGTRAATFASGLRPPAAESWSLGTQVELPPVVAGFRYSERRLISAVAVLDDGARPMVVNPGEGAAANGQPATRFERTVTLSVSHPFWDLWTLDASARLQWVRANVLAASLLEAGPLHEPVEVWLPEVKVSAGRAFPLGPSCTLQLGASVAVWRVPPGSERFITVPGDLDFADRIDFRIGMSIRAWREGWVQLTAEGFDLFDSGRRRSQLEGRSVRFGLEVGF